MNKAYSDPHRPTLDDLNPESATTDRLVALVHSHHEDEDYPTPEPLLGNLPVALRALCNHLLTGPATAIEVAYRLASIIDAVEGGPTAPAPPWRRHQPNPPLDAEVRPARLSGCAVTRIAKHLADAILHGAERRAESGQGIESAFLYDT